MTIIGHWLIPCHKFSHSAQTIGMRKFCIIIAAFMILQASAFACFSPSTTVSSSKSEPTVTELSLPVLMYHSVLKNRTGKYIVSPVQLENDIIAIKKAGFTTVFLSEVIDWVDGKGTLPPKPIVLTFDDGHYNNMHYGLPIFQKHDVKVMINPVTSFSRFSTDSGDHSNPNYSHLTWDQIGTLGKSGHVEFGNHTHALHKQRPRFGIMQVGGEDLETYLDTIRKDIEKAQDFIQACGVPRPQTFAYPFGKATKEGKRLLIDELGFRAILTCSEGISTIRQDDKTSLHSLKRYNRHGHLCSDSVLKIVNPQKTKSAN